MPRVRLTAPIQNPHESLIAELSNRCVAGQRAFRPDIFEKGPGRREPVDLVWATNQVVLLMSMKGGAGAAKSKAQDKSWRQLRGVLREWRSGRNLVGRNDQLTFDLPYDDNAHVILLSLLEPDQLPLVVRDDLAEQLNVALVASMPQHLLERLVWRHGSSRDLVELLVAARNQDRRIEGAQAVEALDSLHAFAYTHSRFGRQPLNRTDLLSQALAQLVDVWRLQSRASTVSTASPLALDPASTIDDLGWKGFFDILGTLHDPVAPASYDLQTTRPIGYRTERLL